MRLGGTDTKTHRFQNAAIVKRNAYHGDTMHGRAAAPVAAQCDDDVATIGIAALCQVMRPVDVQTHCLQQPFSGYQRIERPEYPLQMAGIVYETVFGLPFAWNERACREAEAQRGYHLLNARVVLCCVGADDPQRVCMVLEAAL